MAVLAPGVPSAPSRERRVVAVTLAVAACCWIVVAVLGRSAEGPHQHGLSSSVGAVDQAVFTIGWLVMVAAMMLPPSVRFVGALGRLLAGAPHGRGLLLVGVGAYALPWLLVGQLFQLGDVGVHAAVEAWGWLGARPHLVTAAALVAAGVYQLAPVKLRCLLGCRNPAGFLARGWHGRSPVRDLLHIGAGYGWSCVGCCWALMLIMFAAGITSLGLMAALTVVMVAERRLRRFDVLVPALGVGLLVWGALTAIGTLPPLGA